MIGIRRIWVLKNDVSWVSTNYRTIHYYEIRSRKKLKRFLTKMNIPLKFQNWHSFRKPKLMSIHSILFAYRGKS